MTKNIILNANEQDLLYMKHALLLAEKAAEMGEVPVGCVIVSGGEIIGEGFNLRETTQSPLSHAEVEAIAQACQKRGVWRVLDSTLYVTLEPCPMCAGAILNARIQRVVFGAFDPKNGACGSVANLFEMPFTHKIEYSGGVLKEDCAKVLSAFFKQLRNPLPDKVQHV